MDITKHLVKPIEVEILGEKVQMKPLRVKHYNLISRYQILAIKSKEIAKYNSEHEDKKNLSKEEKEEYINLDLELSFLILSEIFEGLKKEEFNELPIGVINSVMNVFWKLHNPDYDEIEDAKKELRD